MAGIVRVAEADDHSLIVLVDWVGFEIDERTWEPFKGIFEAAPELLLASRANLVFNCDVLNFLAFSLYQACCSNLFVFVQRLWGCCDEMRLSVEFVTVGFLGICRQYCCD